MSDILDSLKSAVEQIKGCQSPIAYAMTHRSFDLLKKHSAYVDPPSGSPLLFGFTPLYVWNRLGIPDGHVKVYYSEIALAVDRLKYDTDPSEDGDYE